MHSLQGYSQLQNHSKNTLDHKAVSLFPLHYTTGDLQGGYACRTGFRYDLAHEGILWEYKHNNKSTIVSSAYACACMGFEISIDYSYRKQVTAQSDVGRYD